MLIGLMWLVMPSRIVWTQEMLDELPKTIGEAIATDSIYYFNNSLCPKGHLCARKAADGKCHYCAREQKKIQQAKIRERIRSGEYQVRSKSENYFHGKSRSLEAWMLRLAKNRAKKKNLEFDVNVTDISIPTHCHILGIKLDCTWGGVEETDANRANKPSLDRIDSSKGYIKRNIQVMSYRANLIKGDGTAEEHRLIAKYILSEYEKRG